MIFEVFGNLSKIAYFLSIKTMRAVKFDVVA